jgi:serine/threonine-protein kinase
MAQTGQLNAALTGRYAIDRLIGEGGMATVYLARDLRHHRNVALKVLRPDLGAVLGLERFESEIKVTANLQHPNLLPLFDSGAADNLLFYVMPYVEGESLRSRLEREKQLPIEEAVRIAVAVGSALDYAHRHGVIHRDLKPENILLHDGQPLVADFGIALAVSNAGGSRVTQTGVSLGTPQYMSPEQATGDRAIDARADVYALGAVTYEMLTGEPPHSGTTSQAIIARLMTERPRPIRASRASVPEQVEAAVERALEKLPADRWATAKEFGEALTGMRIATRATTAGMPAAAAKGQRPAPRELAAWGMAAVAVATAGFLALRPEPTPPPAVAAEFEVTLPDSLVLTTQGGASSVAVSPDGGSIVFQARMPGEPHALYLRRLGESFVEKIRGTDSAASPVFSPDGSELLFSALAQGANGPVMRLPLRGGVPRGVVDSAARNGQVSWGDAGLIVVAHRNRLWTVPEGGGPRTLLAAPDSARSHRRYGFPAVLPGGEAALLVIWKGANILDSSMIGVVTIPEGKVTELELRGTYPRYSSTGHLLFLTPDGSAMAAPFDPGTLRTTGPANPVLQNVRVGGGGAAGFGVGSGGTLAYLSGGLTLTSSQSRRASGWHLVAVSRNGAERDLGAPPNYYFVGRLSPDARQIAVMISINWQWRDPDIWRFELDSRQLSRVTTDSGSVYPDWTPDGERIVFARQPADTALFQRPLYATGQTTALFGFGDSIRSFSLGPARGYLAFRVQRSNSTPDIWLVHQDSVRSARRFAAEPYTETAPDFSPDGRLLAYTTNRTGRNEVYVRTVPGGAELKVSVDGGSEPKWGREPGVLYYRGPDYLMAARVVERPRLDVTQRDSLFRDIYIRLGASGNSANYDVFPGGQEFLMMRGGPQAGVDLPSLMVLTNWHLRRAPTAGAPDPY